MSNFNYQQMIDQMLEEYEATLDGSQEEQNLIGDRVDSEMRGLKLHSLRNAAVALFPHADHRQVDAVMNSGWMDEKLGDLQREIVQRMVMLERAWELSQAEAPAIYDEVA
ncbi:hypothetical protein NJH77_21480 [Serratia fonticola]|uniref:hypothetical protein n=1 Tax=Serratia fonticola TaxID=47917 RepID=UPI0020981089|nr:hypothetical protein [Serratia fonticola]MCO7511826.1 hypothetical protein [Serratia fonticola]